jgi:hypothetical protein
MQYNKEKLKIKFNGYDTIDTNHSQAAQDLFVLMCLDGKRNGTYLDLGCNHPIEISNTYLLEKSFDWTGIGYDIDASLVSKHEGIRKNKAFVQDATKINFDETLKHYNSNHIDYLSLDLEPADVTLECLKSIPFDKIEFSLITFEHDSYRFGEYCRDISRYILEGAGYKRICSDISNVYNIYEDWYYNPKYVNFENIKSLESDKKEWSDIVYE